MKKEFLLVLLNHLKSANITNIDKILNYDERILNLLAQFDTIHLSKALDIVKVEPNLELCLKKLNILYQLEKNNLINQEIDYSKFDVEMLATFKKISPGKAIYIEKLFTSNLVNKNKKYLEKAIDLIKQSPNLFNARCASDVLCDSNAIKAGIAIDGAKIINESQNEFNSLYASIVLCNPDVIKSGLAITSAKIINKSKNKENCLLASLILKNFLNVIDSIKLINYLNKFIKMPSIMMNLLFIYLNNKNIQASKSITEDLENTNKDNINTKFEEIISEEDEITNLISYTEGLKEDEIIASNLVRRYKSKK